MTNIKTIWWLIQINAAACFLFIGAIGQSDASDTLKIFAFILLVISAALEYVAYHSIYKKTFKKVIIN